MLRLRNLFWARNRARQEMRENGVDDGDDDDWYEIWLIRVRNAKG